MLSAFDVYFEMRLAFLDLPEVRLATREEFGGLTVRAFWSRPGRGYYLVAPFGRRGLFEDDREYVRAVADDAHRRVVRALSGPPSRGVA